MTVDAQGRLTLPPEAQARLAQGPGQTLVIDVDLPVEQTPVGEGENPFLRFIGTLSPWPRTAARPPDVNGDTRTDRLHRHEGARRPASHQAGRRIPSSSFGAVCRWCGILAYNNAEGNVMTHLPKDERLHLRVTGEHHDLIEQAATLEGLTLTGFATRHLVDAATRVVEHHRVTQLGREQAEAFLRALEEGEAPQGVDRLTRHFGRTSLPVQEEP